MPRGSGNSGRGSGDRRRQGVHRERKNSLDKLRREVKEASKKTDDKSGDEKK